MTTTARACAALVLFASFAPPGAGAQTVRRAIPTGPRGSHAAPAATPAAVEQGGVHSAFGQIAQLTPTTFLLRLRSGRIMNVNAAPAVASGRTSAPLFVGKLVLITGAVDSRGTFIAQTVTRMSSIDPTTRVDR